MTHLMPPNLAANALEGAQRQVINLQEQVRLLEQLIAIYKSDVEKRDKIIGLQTDLIKQLEKYADAKPFVLPVLVPLPRIF